MKNIIVTVAVLILIIGILFQFTQETRTHIIISEIETVVNTFKGRARVEGGWSNETIDTMFDVVHTKFPFLDRDEFLVKSSTTQTIGNPRGTMMEYAFEFPIKNVISTFFKSSSTVGYVVSGMVVSEYLDINQNGQINPYPFQSNVYMMSGKPPDRTGITWVWSADKRVWYPVFSEP